MQPQHQRGLPLFKPVPGQAVAGISEPQQLALGGSGGTNTGGGRRRFVRPALPGVSVDQLKQERGEKTEAKLDTIPLRVVGRFADQNLPIHVIIENSSWNACFDNTKQCYDFASMTPRRGQIDEQRMEQQELFNQEPPLAADEVTCLMETWMAFIRDSAARSYVKHTSITFQNLTVDELAKQETTPDDPFISDKYPCTIILTAKTPQKFWFDLYDTESKVVYSEDGRRARAFIKSHLNFVLVNVSRLPIQWYFAKKTRDLPLEWWSKGEPLKMNDWQRERYGWNYSVPQMFLNRTTDAKSPCYDVIYNYVPERHLVLLRDLFAWRIPEARPKEIGKWWKYLQWYGYVTDKGLTWDRPAIIMSYQGRSVSPYTFEPLSRKQTEQKSTKQTGLTPIASANVSSGAATANANDSWLDNKDAFPPLSSTSTAPRSEIFTPAPAPAAVAEGTVEVKRQSLGINRLSVLQSQLSQEKQLRLIAVMAELMHAVEELRATRPDAISAEDWATQRQIARLPAVLDTKNAVDYLRDFRNRLLVAWTEETDKLVLLEFLSDDLLTSMWTNSAPAPMKPPPQPTIESKQTPVQLQQQQQQQPAPPPTQQQQPTQPQAPNLPVAGRASTFMVTNRCQLSGCGTPNPQYYCEYCRSVAYCTARHATVDWSRHANVCQQNVKIKT